MAKVYCSQKEVKYLMSNKDHNLEQYLEQDLELQNLDQALGQNMEQELEHIWIFQKDQCVGKS